MFNIINQTKFVPLNNTYCLWLKRAVKDVLKYVNWIVVHIDSIVFVLLKECTM